MVTVYPADNDKMEYNGNDNEAMTRWNTMAMIINNFLNNLKLKFGIIRPTDFMQRKHIININVI